MEFYKRPTRHSRRVLRLSRGTIHGTVIAKPRAPAPSPSHRQRPCVTGRNAAAHWGAYVYYETISQILGSSPVAAHEKLVPTTSGDRASCRRERLKQGQGMDEVEVTADAVGPGGLIDHAAAGGPRWPRAGRRPRIDGAGSCDRGRERVGNGYSELNDPLRCRPARRGASSGCGEAGGKPSAPRWPDRSSSALEYACRSPAG